VQRFLALLPVAGAKLVSLKRIKYAQNFLRVAAHRKIGDIDKANHVLRIDDERRSLCHAGVLIEDAKLSAEIALDVGQHREGQVLQIGMMRAPCVMNKFGIGTTAQDLSIAIGEFLVELAKCRNFGGANKGEVFRPEEINLPLAGVVRLGDGLEFLALFEANGCSNAEIGEFLAYS